jgi:hypothetical protein
MSKDTKNKYQIRMTFCAGNSLRSCHFICNAGMTYIKFMTEILKICMMGMTSIIPKLS